MPAKILVADDDAMLQRLISNTLKLEQHEVIVATNGPQALEMARTENPDLVILDVMMPGLNGFDVCEALRKDPATTTLPVIMLSGLGQVQEKIMGLKAGADEYLTKPIDPRELLTRVEMLLVRHKILRQSAAVKAGRVYSVIGAKGGVGATTLAVNLTAHMATMGKDVILLEFRPDYGTVAVQLNLRPELSLATLRELEPVAITEQVVTRLFQPTSFKARVLCGPQKAAEFGPFTAGHAGALLAPLDGAGRFRHRRSTACRRCRHRGHPQEQRPDHRCVGTGNIVRGGSSATHCPDHELQQHPGDASGVREPAGGNDALGARNRESAWPRSYQRHPTCHRCYGRRRTIWRPDRHLAAHPCICRTHSGTYRADATHKGACGVSLSPQNLNPYTTCACYRA